jgi:hypothetical protein
MVGDGYGEPRDCGLDFCPSFNSERGLAARKVQKGCSMGDY